MQRIIGIDPGSRITGYGVIDSHQGKIGFVACGVVKTSPDQAFSARLNQIFDGLNEVIQVHEPSVAAIEDVNPRDLGDVPWSDGVNHPSDTL